MDVSPFEDHLSYPRGHGRLERAPHAGVAGSGDCGDVIRLAVRIDDGVIAEAGFEAGGCGAMTAAGSAVVELVEGATLLEAARVGHADVAGALGGLLPSKLHAAVLAADALHRALGTAVADEVVRLASAPRRVVVALSGGVDSGVAALLARERGEEVVAVTLELWSDPAGDGERSCCSPQAVSGARALAHAMGLAHLTLDLRGRFRESVVDPFVGAHAAGD